ncbi:exported hypothetical protein [Klebsiella variicola]|nr:exported hypothetical protein [Klebsiella variicola]
MRASGTVLTLLLAACGASAAEQSESDSYFPIWGDEARARGVFDPVTLRRQPELYEYPSGYHGRQYYLFRA